MRVNPASKRGKTYDLSREVSWTVATAVVTTNHEKSAEAIVPEMGRAEQLNRAKQMYVLKGQPDSGNKRNVNE